LTAGSATLAAPMIETASPSVATKIMIVVLENTDYAAALQQPFLTSLAKQGALLTNLSAEAHPSQPNYIALVAGSTFGVVSDDNVTIDRPHLGDLVEAKGLQWKVYAEGYPGNCYLGAAAGTYARKHVPFLSFRDVQQDPRRCARMVNADQLQSDIRDGTLPSFSLYIPDLNDDGHDTGVAYADRWLAGTFGPILQDPNSSTGLLLIVTFDESASSLFGGNRVATIIVGGAVRPGTVLSDKYNHYSLLRLVEDQLGLGSLGQGDKDAAVITGLN
jgi:acid phosphatase